MTDRPLIAIVGRPNVGKSTFFNRVLEQRKAIIDAREGITRDRIYGTTDWVGHELSFIDTGGYIPEDIDTFNSAVRQQAQMAIQEAELILFMVDGRVEPTASDQVLAQFIRETGKPYVLVVNKCDSLESEDQIFLYHELGMEPVLPISALTGRRTGDLLDVVVEKLSLKPQAVKSTDNAEMQLAIVGMPNVGKSLLCNALLQKEQTIVTPIAGTTRDSIDTTLRWYGKNVILIDTAGLRKKSKLTDSIEYYSNIRTQQTISRSDVVLVLIDAVKGFGKQDKLIVDAVIQKGKGLVIVVNKWDLVEKDTGTLRQYQQEIASQFKAVNHYPMLFISALTRQRVSKILDIAWNVYLARRQKLSTGKLNDWLDRATSINPPPAIKGKAIKIKFATQVHVAPLILALFSNYPAMIPMFYQRYLENNLRDNFQLKGVPVKISFRKK